MNKTLILFITTLVLAAASSNKCNPDDCLLKCCNEQGTCGRFVADCKEFSECKIDSDCKSTLLKCTENKCAPSMKLLQNPSVAVLEGALLDILDSANLLEANEDTNTTKSALKTSKIVNSNTKTQEVLEKALYKIISELDFTNVTQTGEIDDSVLHVVGALSLNPLDEDSKDGTLSKLKSTEKKADTKSNSQSSTKSNSKEIENSALNFNKPAATKKELSSKYKYVRQNAKIFDDSDELSDDEAKTSSSNSDLKLKEEGKYTISEIYGNNSKQSNANGKHHLSSKTEEEILDVLKGLLEKAYRDYDSQSEVREFIASKTIDKNNQEDSDDDDLDIFDFDIDDDDAIWIIVGYAFFWLALVALIKVCVQAKRNRELQRNAQLQQGHHHCCGSIQNQTQSTCLRNNTNPNQTVELPTVHHHHQNVTSLAPTCCCSREMSPTLNQSIDNSFQQQPTQPLLNQQGNNYQVSPHQHLRNFSPVCANGTNGAANANNLARYGVFNWTTIENQNPTPKNISSEL